MPPFPFWPDHLLAIIFGIILPLVTVSRTPKNFEGIVFTPRTKNRLYLSNSLALAVMALVIIIVWFWQSRRLGQLGFQSMQPSENLWIAWASIGIFIFIYTADVWYNFSAAKLMSTKERFALRTPFLPNSFKELPVFLIMCLSAGIFEEIIFRGFLVTYMQALLQQSPQANGIAIVLPALIFSVAHYYQGWHAVLKIFVMAVLFGMMFLHSQSIYIAMLLHTLVDVAGGLMSIWLYKKTNE
jgi:uncharacterized protein